MSVVDTRRLPSAIAVPTTPEALRRRAAADDRADAPRAVTWRSLLVGTAAVALVCGLTPYNDFVLSDTSLAAGFMPLAAVLILFVLVVGINAPLHRWAPRRALTTGELAVVVLMTLVACGLPNWGLMRFLVPQPVAPFHLGASDAQFWRAFTGLDLPAWLFPVPDVAEGRTSPIVTWFYRRVPAGERIPWSAWAVPLVAWGVFAFAMLATLVAVARLVLEQWANNERLPFPLVQVQAALIEPPAPGRSLNDLFRSRTLWVGLTVVFVIHSLSGLNAYFPKNVPDVPLGYDLTGVFADPPFSYLRAKVKAAVVSFTIVGVTYFIRSKAAFSLWAVYLLVNLVDVQHGVMQREMLSAAWGDQHLGACIAFIAGILWIGRHHWGRVLRAAVGAGRDRTYALTFWIAIAGVVTMLGWLWVVGVQLWVAAMIVSFILAAHLVVARVVAETGLPFYRSGIQASQVYTNLPAAAFTGRDIYFAGVFTVLGPLTTRDSVMTFALHGMGVTRAAGVADRAERRGVAAAIALTLIVGFGVAAATTLYCQYSYPTPMTRDAVPQGNNFGAVYVPERDVADPFVAYTEGRFPPKKHSPIVHVAIGFVVTALLEVASLRWASWPLLPVGFVASYGAFIQNAWFSVFVGWLAKVLIVRFGGSSLFQRARPLFVGIIFGEGLAAGVWLVINAILVLNGYESRPVKFLL
jgi:hypothetical protein